MAVVAAETRLVLMLAVLSHGTLSASDECRDAVAPPTEPRGVNQVDRTSATPLFELHATPTENTRKQDTPVKYKISISIGQGNSLRFSEAAVAVKTNGTCGVGTFHFNSKDFVEVVQEQGDNCPLLIKTIRRTHMTELHPLVWEPPLCGCVQIRILIVASGQSPIYYAENEGVISGPLAKTICIPSDRSTQMTREQRLDSLCHVIDKHSSAEILSRAQFTRRRELEARWMDRYGLEMALDLRRSDAKICCSQVNHEKKMACFDDVRRRRIDEFCEDGASDIPFRAFRRQHMRKLEDSCCFILGEFRYKCFAQNSDLPTATNDATPFDFSMDASDVVNDLADFGSYQHLDEFLMPKYPGKNGEKNSPGGDNEMEWENEDDDDIDRGGGEVQTDDEDDGIELEDKKDDVDFDGGFEDDDVNEERVVEYSPVDTSKRFAMRKPAIQRAPRKRRPSGSPKTASQPTASPEYFPTTSDASSLRRPSSAERTRRRKLRKRQRRIESWENERGRSGSRRRPARGGRRLKGRRGKAGSQTSTEQSKYEPEGSFLVASGKDGREMYGERSKWRKTQSQGHVEQRQPINEKFTSLMAPGDDMEDQGGALAEKTLRRLQRKMRRVRLLNECCLQGSQSGHRVYGGLEQVKAECRHSGRKYVTIGRLSAKISRKCLAQFVECCSEAAKTGLTMASHEFPDSFHWGNSRHYDPDVVGKTLAQRGRHTPPVYRRREGSPVRRTPGQPEDDYFHAAGDRFPVEMAYRRGRVASSHLGFTGRDSFLESNFDRRYPAHHRIPPSPMPDVFDTDRFPSQPRGMELLPDKNHLDELTKPQQQHASTIERTEKQGVEKISKNFRTSETSRDTIESLKKNMKLENSSPQPSSEISKSIPSTQSAEMSTKQPLSSRSLGSVNSTVKDEIPVSMSQDTNRKNSTKFLNAVENSTQKSQQSATKLLNAVENSNKTSHQSAAKLLNTVESLSQKSHQSENSKSGDAERKPASPVVREQMEKKTPSAAVGERVEFVVVVAPALKTAGVNGSKGRDGDVKERRKVPDGMSGQDGERGVDRREGAGTKEDWSDEENGDEEFERQMEVKERESQSKGLKERRGDKEAKSVDANEEDDTTKAELVNEKLQASLDRRIEKAIHKSAKPGIVTESTKIGVSRLRNGPRIAITGISLPQPVTTKGEKNREDKTVAASHRQTSKATPAKPANQKTELAQRTKPNLATLSNLRSQRHKSVAQSKKVRAKQRKNKGRKNKMWRKYSRKRLRNGPKFSSGLEALDSREMAERNSKRFSVPLDSREMAEQYDRQSRKNLMPNYRFYTKSSKRINARGSFWF